MSQQVLTATKSEQTFAKAEKVIVGGVNSPVRACKSVGTNPIFIDRADGAYMHDIDGKTYIDYVGSWGPMILGHRHPRVLEALEHSLQLGTSYGAPSVGEVDLAELVCRLVPSMEMVRMVCSGTEACMSAIRLARAYTKRNMVIKFDGCYHGHADSFLVRAGSGLATLGIASCPGVPEEISKLTLSLPYNDLDCVKKAFEQFPKEIACIIVEPIVGNSGLILPKEGYLAGLKELATKYGALFIMDEVMTGFRVSSGGAQKLYDISPDLTCLGKIIGGGLPVGAYGGRKEIMEMIAPSGPVYQAGTLAGNPLSMAAGLAQLKSLQAPGTYEKLQAITKRLADGLIACQSKSKVPFQVISVCGMIGVFFTDKQVVDLESAMTANTGRFGKFWRKMIELGIYWPPSQFESAFLSLVHSNKDIDETISAFEQAVSQLD